VKPPETANPEVHAVVLYADLVEKFGINLSKTHLARLEAAGKFPRRFHPTPGRTAWLQSEIREWLAESVAQRDTRPARPVPKQFK